MALLQTSPATANAYCALRDPSVQIYALYPQADHYRSIVRRVDTHTREALAHTIPFNLHAKELGQHTLYVTLNAGQPLGLIHVRSEPGRWGLIEIIWALSLEGRVMDYRFQRCREQACRSLPSPAVLPHLRNKPLADVVRLLASIQSAEQFWPESVTAIEGADALAETLIRSAIKTIAVTQHVWGNDLSVLQKSHSEAGPE